MYFLILFELWVVCTQDESCYTVAEGRYIMTNKAVVTEVKKIASTDNGKTILTYLASKPNTKLLTVERMLTGTKNKISRNIVVQFCKNLDNLDLGNFVVGRRTLPSHIIFYATPESIGNVGLGKVSKFTDILRLVASAKRMTV